MSNSSPHNVVLPDGWPRPSGYSNAIVANGTYIFLAGQIGWNTDRVLVSSDMVQQARKALENIVTLLRAAGAQPQHVVRLTWYLSDKAEYQLRLAEIGAAYRDAFGNWYPAMSAVQVSALIEDGAKVEIEATAVVPHDK